MVQNANKMKQGIRQHGGKVVAILDMMSSFLEVQDS